MSKRKGAAGERELAVELSWLLDSEAHRGRQYHGGPDSPDVKVDISGLHVECKRVEAFSLYSSLEQALRDAKGDIPIVCHRRNRKPWVAVIYLSDLPRLVRLLSERVS